MILDLDSTQILQQCWAVFLLTLFDQNLIVYLEVAEFVLSTWVHIGDFKIFLLQ